MLLPLFPLNTVLFPSMPLQLHIFEERYKVMINECVETQSPFGVVLIESGDEALGPLAKPRMIGTTAHITNIKKLPFGRMNLVALGRDRFRIREMYQDKPYLSADVDMLPLDDDPFGKSPAVDRLRPLVHRYLKTLEDAGKVDIDDKEIPRNPTALAFLASIILQTENTQKQTLLEADSTNTLITDLITMYRREVALLDAMLHPPLQEQSNQTPFSLN